MLKIIATTTWNNGDIVPLFLDYSRTLGFDRVLVMDFASADGTAEILQSANYSRFVDRLDFPGLAGLDSSRLLLEYAKTEYGPDVLCLFCDPDEFLVVPGGFDWRQWSREMSGAVVVPRFNVTAPREAILAAPAPANPFGALNLRIESRVSRNPVVDVHRDELTPPWIYTDIPGKVFVRIGKALSIGDGDHQARLDGVDPGQPPDGMYLLHFPFRSFEQFEAKTRMNALDFHENPQLAEGFGWQSRRWIRIARKGGLWDEYLQQFPAAPRLQDMLRAGQLRVDRSVQRLLGFGSVLDHHTHRAES